MEFDNLVQFGLIWPNLAIFGHFGNSTSESVTCGVPRAPLIPPGGCAYLRGWLVYLYTTRCVYLCYFPCILAQGPAVLAGEFAPFKDRPLSPALWASFWTSTFWGTARDSKVGFITHNTNHCTACQQRYSYTEKQIGTNVHNRLLIQPHPPSAGRHTE